MRIFLKNIFLLLIRIFSILIIYQLCRLLYFFYNINYFANINFVSYLKIIQGSIKFDISAVFYINSLVILFSLIPSNLIVKNWYKEFISFLFISCNFLGILVNIIDVFMSSLVVFLQYILALSSLFSGFKFRRFLS